MAEVHSIYLNRKQLASLERIGDMYIPARGDFPGFSRVGCIEHVDTVLQEIDSGDARLFALLLTLLRFVPAAGMHWLLGALDNHHHYPEPIAGLLRLLNLSLKGVVMSLYYSGMTGAGYSGRNPLEVIDYHVHCEADE